ncbi:MAG: hypothetical protein SFV21_12220 [Rhodospirillaceae bacterium]|nr:hypothetical protein [Rhodospirillaceae bacterium]
MSSDIPIILAHDPGSHIAAFAGAASTAQLQQYATAGWQVALLPGFAAPQSFAAGQVPATAVAALPHAAALFGLQAAQWSDDTPAAIAAAQPGVVKINAAFGDDADAERAKAAASALAGLGYLLIGAHWRDDNTQRLRGLNRVEPLAALEPPEWKRLDLIGCRAPTLAERIVRIGRVHAGQERRVAELRLAEALRADYIMKMEDALQALQGARKS